MPRFRARYCPRAASSRGCPELGDFSRISSRHSVSTRRMALLSTDRGRNRRPSRTRPRRLSLRRPSARIAAGKIPRARSSAPGAGGSCNGKIGKLRPPGPGPEDFLCKERGNAFCKKQGRNLKETGRIVKGNPVECGKTKGKNGPGKGRVGRRGRHEQPTARGRHTARPQL